MPPEFQDEEQELDGDLGWDVCPDCGLPSSITAGVCVDGSPCFGEDDFPEQELGEAGA